MIHPVQGIVTVALQELTDSIRSRRALVLIVLYLLGAAVATWVFLSILGELEGQLQKSIGIKQAANVGGVTATLWKSQGFKDLVTNLVGDKDLAQTLLGIPPLGLFYGWLAFTFAPLFVILTVPSRISEEIWSGSARFVLFRTSRLVWVTGKLAGQALQLLLALFLGAAGVWLVGWFRMAGFEPLSTAWALFALSLKAWVFAFAFIGLATGVSQICASPYLAQVLGIFSLVAFAALKVVAAHYSGPGWHRLWDLAALLLPQSYRLDLWRPDLPHAARGGVFLLALGFAFMLAGYAFFSRKNI